MRQIEVAHLQGANVFAIDQTPRKAPHLAILLMRLQREEREEVASALIPTLTFNCTRAGD
ncbi:MAG: hypothetical protein ABIP75_19940 [Pyrinomonadaceae bacterium]